MIRFHTMQMVAVVGNNSGHKDYIRMYMRMQEQVHGQENMHQNTIMENIVEMPVVPFSRGMLAVSLPIMQNLMEQQALCMARVK